MLITNHLLDLGHKKIAYVTGPLDSSETPRIRRLEGIKETVASRGLPEDTVTLLTLPKEIWQLTAAGNRHYRTGYDMTMIKLNDYLYSGDTVLKILRNYTDDLRKSAKKSRNQIDFAHCNFLLQIADLLTRNEFLTSQSQRIREFYLYMSSKSFRPIRAIVSSNL